MEKNKIDNLKDKLFCDHKNGYFKAKAEDIKESEPFCEGYKAFLDEAKTEREAVKHTIMLAEQAGFYPFDKSKKYAAGDRFYINNRGKTIALVVMGENPVEDGLKITAAHIDSPRLDLKPNPLYEDRDLALFKTHYYGGIRKYQWTAVPLALHGVVIKKDFSKVEVNIGEDANDPVFVVNDLLPHLATEQNKRTLAEGIKGEELNILIGSRPFGTDPGAELVKLNILSILNEKYSITEDDFVSAELECVPAFGARDLGLDRSMIGAYGQDDRVCAYTALMAILNCKNPSNTAVCILADKEETGSDGNTGLNSAFLKYVAYDIAALQQADGALVLRNSKCLSADVSAALDPTFPEVCDPRNAAYLNGGVCIMKYTGARGKGGTSDADAEYMAYIRDMLDSEGIVWQTGELGKVDAGGGGTVAKYIANLGVDVVDIGVPVLSMHAPFETTAKLDIYMTYRAFLKFNR